MDKPIGIIDSGVGGLTVLKEAEKQLPNERFIYLGDNLRCPYGSRESSEIVTFTREMINYLLQYDVKLIVIACNTATALALEYLAQEVPVPMLGVVYPGSLAATKQTTNGHIGVIGTVATINSEIYKRTIQSIDPAVRIYSLACPAFVPIIESGVVDGKELETIVEAELMPLKRWELDTLILGCTHFPLIKDIIRESIGNDITLIDSGAETARKLKKIVLKYGIQNTNKRSGAISSFKTTGDVSQFQKIANLWLDKRVWNIEKVDLSQRDVKDISF